MTTFITQGRFTRDGLNEMIDAPGDLMLWRIIAQSGGKPVAHYLTSGEYDVMLIFEASSYDGVVPALIVAAARSGLTDLKTVIALTSEEMKSAFEKAGSVAESSQPAAKRPVGLASAGPPFDLANDSAQVEITQEDEEAKAATAILDAQKEAVENTRAGRPAPYYFAPAAPAAPSTPASSAPSAKNGDAARK